MARRLSNRQIEILGLIAQGETDKQIAAKLGISEETVPVLVNVILTKLAVRTRSEAVYSCFRGPEQA